MNLDQQNLFIQRLKFQGEDTKATFLLFAVESLIELTHVLVKDIFENT